MSVHWILSGNYNRGSSRIHGFNIHMELCRQGVSSYINYYPKTTKRDLPFSFYTLKMLANQYSKKDIVIIQKFRGRKTLSFLENLKKNDIPIIYLDSDLPCKTKEAKMASCVVVPSEFLADIYKRNGVNHVFVIHDAVERIKPPTSSVNPVAGSLKCVWFGRYSESRFRSINKLKEWVSELNKCSEGTITITTISDHKFADYKWEMSSFDLIHNFDLLVVPEFNTDLFYLAKSSNRATQAMALGLPVLCSPIPSYVKVVFDGYNGYICKSEHEWKWCLSMLKDHPEKLICLKHNAYDFAYRYFNVEVITKQWIELFYQLGFENKINNIKENKIIKGAFFVEEICHHVVKKLSKIPW